MDDGTRARILIVEDNTDTQLLLMHLLRRDYDIEMRRTVHEAVEAAVSTQFDLLILDINLGEELTGIDVLDRARALPASESIPAIAMTAYAMPGDRERFLDLGFSAYLAKPFTRTTLLSCVQRVLASSARLKNC